VDGVVRHEAELPLGVGHLAVRQHRKLIRLTAIPKIIHQTGG
jgi:hypothetical protein